MLRSSTIPSNDDDITISGQRRESWLPQPNNRIQQQTTNSSNNSSSSSSPCLNNVIFPLLSEVN